MTAFPQLRNAAELNALVCCGDWNLSMFYVRTLGFTIIIIRSKNSS